MTHTPDGGAPVGIDPDAHPWSEEAAWRLDPLLAALLVASFASLLALSVVWILPVRYASIEPGPIFDTLGKAHGTQLIQISGHKTYPTSGHLDLTTVSVYGGPGAPLHLFHALKSWLEPTSSVVPQEQIFPPGVSAEEEQEQNAEEMVGSQESATAAALTELGIKYTTTLTLSGAGKGTDAAKVVRKGDVLIAVNGKKVDGLRELRDVVHAVKPGTKVTLTVERNDKERDLVVRTQADPDDGTTQLGVFIDPSFTFPFEVKISIDNVGGPSAGTMFALGIVDTLTPGPMTGGRHIAGTGVIDPDGIVGPIGGIRQKMAGARERGAEFFLVPAENCSEAFGHVPSGLRDVSIDSLSTARDAVEAIGTGRGVDALPHCKAEAAAG